MKRCRCRACQRDADERAARLFPALVGLWLATICFAVAFILHSHPL